MHEKIKILLTGIIILLGFISLCIQSYILTKKSARIAIRILAGILLFIAVISIIVTYTALTN